MIRVIKFVALALCAVVMFGAAGETLYAQGSRKDDIVFNAQGKPMAGAGVRVCTSPPQDSLARHWLRFTRIRD